MPQRERVWVTRECAHNMTFAQCQFGDEPTGWTISTEDGDVH
jgi:hypothetical protein